MTRIEPGHNRTNPDMSGPVRAGQNGLDRMSGLGLASETLPQDVRLCPAAENCSEDTSEILEDLTEARAARAAGWRILEAEREALCAGLSWQDCVRALVKAKRMTPAIAGFMGVDL